MPENMIQQTELPQIHLIRDTDLGVFAYELHILAGDFLRESEFNLRTLATNTGVDSIAIMGKRHMWLSDAVFAYCSTGDLRQMALTTEYIGARAFLFHADRKEDGHLYGDVLMMDLDTLRQDMKENTLYPGGVSMERKDGSRVTVSLEEWNAMELYEKDALKSWGFAYEPEQVAEWQNHYSIMFSQWKDQAFSYMPQDLEERLNMGYMEDAQNPDMDKYRIPLGTAGRCFLTERPRSTASCLPGRKSWLPLRRSLRASGMKITGNLPLHRRTWALWISWSAGRQTGSWETGRSFTKTKNGALPRSGKDITLTGGDDDWQEYMKILAKRSAVQKKIYGRTGACMWTILTP